MTLQLEAKKKQNMSFESATLLYAGKTVNSALMMIVWFDLQILNSSKGFVSKGR